MSKLETPYSTSRLWFDQTGTAIIDIKDREGFNVATLYRDDADEILKRINGYEKLEQSNKEMLGLLRDLCGGGQFFWSAIELDYDFDGEAFEKRVLTAITNAERDG